MDNETYKLRRKVFDSFSDIMDRYVFLDNDLTLHEIEIRNQLIRFCEDELGISMSFLEKINE